MNWDDMRIFLSVSRAESLTGAAKTLHLDPATLGRRISRLEDRLGAALFAKSPQGYALTERGQRLLEHALQAEEALARAYEEQGGPGLRGQIRIGAPDGCASYLLPQVCAEIRARNPGLEIQILALPLVVNLSKREADMAITVSPPQAGRLRVAKITDYQLHLAAHEGYLAAHAPIRSLEDVRGHPVIGYIADMIFDKELDYLGALGVDGTAMASNSAVVQMQMLRAGAGLGIVHDFALPFAPEIRRLLPEQFSLKRAFYLVRHESDQRSERLNSFARKLQIGLQAEIARLEAAA